MSLSQSGMHRLTASYGVEIFALKNNQMDREKQYQMVFKKQQGHTG